MTGTGLDDPAVIAPGTRLIDPHYLGNPEVIAACVLESTAGGILIDPGPSCSLPALEAGLGRIGVGIGEIRVILLTHIHLDHAGSVGTLVRKNPADGRCRRPGVRVGHDGAQQLARPRPILAEPIRLAP